MKSFSFYVLRSLVVLFLPLVLISCGKVEYSSTAPAAQRFKDLAALEESVSVPATDAKFAYVFSDNIVVYTPPCPPELERCPAPITYTIGNPLHSYAIEPVSGMLSLKGVEVDSPPVKTIAVKVSPSDRFLYMLTGDDLLYTFSIGFSYFTEAEFTNQNLLSLGLYNALSQDGYINQPVFTSAEIVRQLNTLLEEPDLYDMLKTNQPGLVETEEMATLNADTSSVRTKLFSELTEKEQKAVIRLNRLVIEAVYPEETPANKGVREQHAIGEPVETPPAIDEVAFASIELDPLGDYVYVLGRRVVAGYEPDPVTGTPTPRYAQGVAVYIRNRATGQLSLSGTQPIGIGQLIFTAAGRFAYGSSNGSLQAYSIDRLSGLLTEVGTPFSFRAWVEGPDYNKILSSESPPPPPPPWHKAPFQNMAVDPTGKFLYLIGSSGTAGQIDRETGVCSIADHQLGSWVYTFIIDPNSGKLTQAGPPIDTTPHIITAISVDPFGRFVQLLNTHEFHGPSYQHGSCSLDLYTAPLNAGALYSYYVEQASGKLIASGSLQVGGTQVPTGFVAAGANSVSITTNTSGRFLYLLNPTNLYLYNVDQANGALTAVGSPLTGATATAMPGPYTTPVTWPSVCFTDGVLNSRCTKESEIKSRAHSLIWAGY